MIFFTADQHLYHRNIIHMKKRPYRNVDEMALDFVNRWNAVVHDEDTIYVLGDFIGKEPVDKQRIMEVGSQLHGHKILLQGNHDRDYPMKEIFETVYNGRHVQRIEYEGRTFFLNHFPANMSFTGDLPSTIYLQAHQHHGPAFNQFNSFYRIPCFDVGVDANQYTPVSIDEIITCFDNPPATLPQLICEKCGEPMALKSGPFGQFYSCRNYATCKNNWGVTTDRRTAEEKNSYRQALKKKH